MADPRHAEVVIVGTGFSGLAVAIELKKAGVEDFVLLERAAGAGGTWRDNVYPGCACDVPSHLYSFSFAPKHDWTRTFSPQPEIRAYLEEVVARFDLRKHMLFEREAISATWDAGASRWSLRTRGGEEYRGRFLVMATGALSNPEIPALPGIERFRGAQFHSARWDHGFDLAGKRVAVVGTGASAIQFVPQIQPRVARLFLLQRTPPWVLPRRDRAYSRAEKAALRWIPGLRWLYRLWIYAVLEGRVFGFVEAPTVMKAVSLVGKWNLARSIDDPALRETLTPSYTPGCKRLLMSNDYYPALAQPNVEVITESIAEVGERSVRFRDGRAIEDIDAILYGTGFRVHDYLGGIGVVGREGASLAETWKRAGAFAYLGTTVAGFPNFFLMTGPNTGLGHTSMIVMIEGQARYVASAIRVVRADGAASIEPMPEAQTAYNDWLRRKTAHTVWSSGCRSWYLDANGRNTTLWPGLTLTFRRRATHFRREEHILRASSEGRPAAASRSRD